MDDTHTGGRWSRARWRRAAQTVSASTSLRKNTPTAEDAPQITVHLCHRVFRDLTACRMCQALAWVAQSGTGPERVDRRRGLFSLSLFSLSLFPFSFTAVSMHLSIAKKKFANLASLPGPRTPPGRRGGRPSMEGDPGEEFPVAVQERVEEQVRLQSRSLSIYDRPLKQRAQIYNTDATTRQLVP